MAEKVPLMRLKVDLYCSKCYKKVFDDKQNIVEVTVVCFDPEKIGDKICCKGGGAIKSIKIFEPPQKPDGKKKDGSDKPESDGDKPIGSKQDDDNDLKRETLEEGEGREAEEEDVKLTASLTEGPH